MKISVIIPVYNVERFLQGCIDSLVNQEFEDYELIFVNDASPDDSRSILKENQMRYPDLIKVIDSPINIKQGGARNLGIKQARGDYIAFVDSDDMVGNDFLKIMWHCVEMDDQVDAVFILYSSICQYMTYDHLRKSENGRGIPLIHWDQNLLDIDGRFLSLKMKNDLLAYPIGGVYCGLWKKAIILENNIWFPEGIRYEDNYWSTIVKCYLNKVKFVQKVGYYYRTNSTSTTHSYNVDFQFDRIIAENQLLADMAQRNLIDSFKTSIEYLYTYRYAVTSFYMYSKMFDIVPTNKIMKIISDLKRNFPDWKQNVYFRTILSKKRTAMSYAAICFPRFTLKLSHIWFKILARKYI